MMSLLARRNINISESDDLNDKMKSSEGTGTICDTPPSTTSYLSPERVEFLLKRIILCMTRHKAGTS